MQKVNVPSIGVEVIQPSAAAPDWWDPNNEGLCIWAAYQPKGAANQAASYIDLSGNGNNAAVGVAPGWDAVNGWRFNGVNQYLTTTFSPQNDQSQSMLVQFTNIVHGGAFESLCGLVGGAGLRYKIDIEVFAPRVRYANGGFVQINRNVVNGNLAVAGNQGYWNGVADGGAIGAWAGPTALVVYIGGANNAGLPGFYLEGDIQAMALYDCTLTGVQVATVETAMAAL